MPVFGDKDRSPSVERRASTRIRISAPVEVHLPAGVRQGQLRDISETGAMVVIDNPPAKGATVMLRWAGHEVYGWVMWADTTGCGLKFVRSISRDVVAETTGQDPGGLAAGAANHSNIPLGQKRSRLGRGI